MGCGRFIERDSVRHLLDIRGGMKAIAIHKLPARLCSQQFTNSSLSGSGRPHQEDDHGSVCISYTWPRNSPSSM